MMVSKALRNSSKVAQKIRVRILRIAGSAGYRPDPDIAKLVTHSYIEGMDDRVRRRAESWGYGFSFIHFEEDLSQQRLLTEVFWAWGE